MPPADSFKSFKKFKPFKSLQSKFEPSLLHPDINFKLCCYRRFADCSFAWSLLPDRFLYWQYADLMLWEMLSAIF
jgi:hypothetical protein